MTTIKTALITGSSSGIGLATAKVLAAQGIQVMLHGIEESAIGDAIAANLERQHNVKARYYCADLAKPALIDGLIEAVISQFGALDILINNAGIQFTSPTVDYPTEKWDLVMAVNLSAAFHTTRLALPFMLKNNWGRIVNIASVHGLVGSANKSAYCATKHGLVGFTKVVALEHAAQGITANCICPGWTDTAILDQQFKVYAENNNISLGEAKRGLIATKSPYPELINPCAIGEMVHFLCSDAATAITGSSLPIDGAWTAQ